MEPALVIAAAVLVSGGGVVYAVCRAARLVVTALEKRRETPTAYPPISLDARRRPVIAPQRVT
jgi:hypothetical protein